MSGKTNYNTSTYSGTSQDLSDILAPLASPTFTGTVSGITQAMVGLDQVDNTSDANKPVSTATNTQLDLKAPLASPTFTGNPRAPTLTAGDNDTNIATTAFVATAVAGAGGGISLSGNNTWTGTNNFTANTTTAQTASLGTTDNQVATTQFVQNSILYPNGINKHNNQIGIITESTFTQLIDSPGNYYTTLYSHMVTIPGCFNANTGYNSIWVINYSVYIDASTSGFAGGSVSNYKSFLSIKSNATSTTDALSNSGTINYGSLIGSSLTVFPTSINSPDSDFYFGSQTATIALSESTDVYNYFNMYITIQSFTTYPSLVSKISYYRIY